MKKGKKSSASRGSVRVVRKTTDVQKLIQTIVSILGWVVAAVTLGLYIHQYNKQTKVDLVIRAWEVPDSLCYYIENKGRDLKNIQVEVLTPEGGWVQDQDYDNFIHDARLRSAWGKEELMNLPKAGSQKIRVRVTTDDYKPRVKDLEITMGK